MTLRKPHAGTEAVNRFPSAGTVLPSSSKEHRCCVRCIMDTSDPDIGFDASGVCNHCLRYEQIARLRVFPADEAKQKLERLISDIQAQGKGKAYDCIIGVSGGVDSSYIAYLARKWGLRPLAVHFDNGWNSELSVKNIERLLKKLDIDLYTYVVDWEEFKDLQLAFLKSSLNNAEIPTDHAIDAVLFRTAVDNGVRYILNGSNTVTEGIMPESWAHSFRDLRLLRSVRRRYGKLPRKTYPECGLSKLVYYRMVRRIHYVYPLDLVPYVKSEAMRVLERELGWRYYGGKHYESIFTRFFQGYILPTKFGIDKRKAHLSTLINSGQITKQEAEQEMRQPAYPAELLEEDRDYVIRKLGITPTQFEELMALPPKSFRDYPSSHSFLKFLQTVNRWLGRNGL